MYTVINRQAWGKMLFPHHLNSGTEGSSNLSVFDGSSEQILKLGEGFGTWALHSAHWISLCPQQEFLPILFLVCIAGKNRVLEVYRAELLTADCSFV